MISCQFVIKSFEILKKKLSMTFFEIVLFFVKLKDLKVDAVSTATKMFY